VLLPVILLLSNAIVGAVQSELPFPTTLLNNLLAIAWLLPWLVMTAAIGFFVSWALLQIAPRRSDRIVWWRGGLTAVAAALVAATALTAFDQLVYQAASVTWTGDGAHQQALTTFLRNALFIGMSAIAGVIVAGPWRTRATPREVAPTSAR